MRGRRPWAHPINAPTPSSDRISSRRRPRPTPTQPTPPRPPPKRPIDGLARLASLEADLAALSTSVGELRARAQLSSDDELSTAYLRELATNIPVLDGRVSKLMTAIDAVAVDDDDARSKRRTLVEAAHALSERVHELPPLLAARVSSAAETHKLAGNAKFKAGEYEAAARCYSEAIAVDRTQPTFFTNRAACHRARSRWSDAVDDARQALTLDVNSPKGYTLLIKSLLDLQRPADAAAALQSAPQQLVQQHAELSQLAPAVTDALKAAGNAALKAAKHDDALKMYTLAISLDGSNPVFYSNRSAVHQARRSWKEALADAQQAIKVDKTFAKAYLHCGRILMAQRQWAEAKTSVQEGLRTLQEAGSAAASCGPLQDLLKEITAQTPRDGGSGGAAAAAAASAGGGGAEGGGQ